MEIKDLTAILVVAMVGCVLVAGFIPVVGESVSATTTFDNTANALWQVDKLDEDSTYEFIWDHTDPTHATVNGETVTLNNGTVICAADTFLIRYGKDGTGYYLQSVPGSTFNLIVYSAGSDAGDVTIIAQAGTFTATIVKGSTTTSTATFTTGFGIVAKGEYVMKAPTQNAYMLDDSPIFAMGLTTLGGIWYNMFQIVGNIEDGVTITQENPDPATYTISNEVINSTVVDGYVGLNTLLSITFTATQIEDSSISADCTYNYFIVPAKITAEKAIHADDNTASIISMIPFILIMGIVLMFVGVVLVRRYV